MAHQPPALLTQSCTLPPLRQALGWWAISLLILVLGAHFFRASAYGLTACCVGALVLHAGRASWKGYAVSFFLCWGAFEWLATGWFLAEMRQQTGLPWIRAAAILLVAFVTCLGAIALYRQHEAKIQPDADPHARLKGLVCIVTFCSIHYLAQASPVPILLLQRFFPLWGAAGNKVVKPIPPTLQWLLRYGRACVLVAGVSLALLLRLLNASMSIVLGLSFAFVCTSLIIMLIVSRRYASMIHCTTFCPLGLVVNILAQCSPWRMKVDSEKCTHCRACEAVCNYRAISPSSRAMGKTHFQCSLCMDCIATCKQGALSAQCVPIPWSKSHHTSIFIAIVTIMHVIFLAFARV